MNRVILITMTEAKSKALLVEDDPFMAALLSEGLVKEGFEIILADNGEDAVAKFKGSKYDVILMDILLPKKNGIEALAEIRLLPGGEKIPALIISNIEEAGYINEAEKLGVKAYLIKANTQIPDIVAKVKEVLKS